eukprot:3321383-Karenia_brevis.AAC.1
MINFREQPWRKCISWSIGNHNQEYHALTWTRLPGIRSCGTVFSPGELKGGKVRRSSPAL